MRRSLIFIRTLAVLSLLVAPPALALTSQEAGKVVGLIEKLQPSFGTLAYDEEVADDWYERDEGEERLIARQGFTKASWRAALDATVRGYLAGIPLGEIDALFAELRQKLAKSPKITAEQKSAMEDFIAEEYAELKQLRAEGAPYEATVRPFVVRLRRLLPARLSNE
ncbi:MAG: hypothetical protein K0R27_516 [Xanthobacteraceae bacterium]|jgi:hypothetical protein|nr:hypothetical protein [Xanthobacteraceae bacterium]